MRRTLIQLALTVLAALVAGPAPASTCVDCHHYTEGMGTSHRFSCSFCHLGHGDELDRSAAHAGLVPNPADFSRPGFICGRCHRDEAYRVARSLMNTTTGIINQTRYLWGAQPDPAPRYATKAIESLAAIPGADGSGPLVDDLLRRDCLRCHLGTAGARRAGDYHAAGCAACHVLYHNDGAAAGCEAPAPGVRGKPARHRISKAIPDYQCLHCHNGNRAGADYAGLFERDRNFSYDFEALDPEQPKLLHGQIHHRLLPDIHRDRGLHCIDCHTREEIMGDGHVYGSSQDAVKIRCTDCHALTGSKPGMLHNTFAREGKLFLKSRIDGRIHPIPAVDSSADGPLNHRIPGHLTRMECSACHAAWTFRDLGLHFVRLDRADYGAWKALMRQDDPQARAALDDNLAKPPDQWLPPVSRDWLSGALRVGAWMSGYSLRRWEGRVLGYDNRGKVSVMRPRYQFWVSQVNARGDVIMDSEIPKTGDGRKALAWNPYAPHTIRRRTPACWDCHGNPGALGLGHALTSIRGRQSVPLSRPGADGLGIDFELDQVIDARGRPLQITCPQGTRFLDAADLKRMSTDNVLYVKYLLEYYAGREAYGDPRGFTGRKR
jgi:hypothetical protein